MPLELDKEVRALAVKSIERYFMEELDEKIGNLREVQTGFDRIVRASDVHIVRHTRLRFGRDRGGT